MADQDALLVTAAEQSYAIPLLAIQEIRGWTPASPLPYSDPACLGVINLRGQVMPVLDARTILGKQPEDPKPQDVIVVAVLQSRPIGLLFDSVSDIVGIPSESISRLDDQATWSSGLIEGVAAFSDRLVPILALEGLLYRRTPD